MVSMCLVASCDSSFKVYQTSRAFHQFRTPMQIQRFEFKTMSGLPNVSLLLSSCGINHLKSLATKRLILSEFKPTTMNHQSMAIHEGHLRWNLNQGVQGFLPLCRPLISRNHCCCWTHSSQGCQGWVAHWRMKCSPRTRIESI